MNLSSMSQSYTYPPRAGFYRSSELCKPLFIETSKAKNPEKFEKVREVSLLVVGCHRGK